MMTKVKAVAAFVMIAIFATQSIQANAGNGSIAEFNERSGLPNFFKKLDEGKEVTIAYLGGSITEQNGWRPQSFAWFKEQYPQVAFKQISAAIGGTGSNLGVFRLENDVLRGNPDLLFVEFAVNDATTRPEEIVKAMEGIVRKTWRHNPQTDICFVYTITFRDSVQLAEGTLKRSEIEMEKVAEHYGIPSVHLGLEAAKLEQQGKLVMKTDAVMTQVSGNELNRAAELATDAEGRIIFSKDGVHPYAETGQVLYTQSLIRAIKAFSPNAAELTHTVVEPIRKDNWEMAQQIPVNEAWLSGTYENLTAQGDPLAKRFSGRLPSVYRLHPGAELSFKFKGTKAMVYDIIGPDGAKLEIIVDGKSRTNTRMDGYCTYHRLGSLSIGDNLEDTVHEVTIRVLDEPLDKEQILFERNRADFAKSPEKYEPRYLNLGMILIVGEPAE